MHPIRSQYQEHSSSFNVDMLSFQRTAQWTHFLNEMHLHFVSFILSRYVAVSLCRCVAVSLCRCVAVSLCRCVAVSLCRCVAVSLCRCVAVSLFLWWQCVTTYRRLKSDLDFQLLSIWRRQNNKGLGIKLVNHSKSQWNISGFWPDYQKSIGASARQPPLIHQRPRALQTFPVWSIQGSAKRLLLPVLQTRRSHPGEFAGESLSSHHHECKWNHPTIASTP